MYIHPCYAMARWTVAQTKLAYVRKMITDPYVNMGRGRGGNMVRVNECAPTLVPNVSNVCSYMHRV